MSHEEESDVSIVEVQAVFSVLSALSVLQIYFDRDLSLFLFCRRIRRSS